GRARSAPLVRDAEVLERERDHAAVRRLRAAAAREEVGCEDGGGGRAARLLPILRELRRGCVEAALDLLHACVGRLAPAAEQDGTLLGVQSTREQAGGVGDMEESPLGARELRSLSLRGAELRVRRRDPGAGGGDLRFQRIRRERDSRRTARSGVKAGESEHLVHVPAGVVVAIDRADEVELPPAADEVPRSAEDRICGAIWIGAAVSIRVDSPAGPG